MSKRPSLADSLRQAVQDEPSLPPASPAREKPPRPEPLSSSVPTARPVGFYAATRVGKKKVTVALDPAMHKQFKSLAVEREATTEELLTEAISDLLAKYG